MTAKESPFLTVLLFGDPHRNPQTPNLRAKFNSFPELQRRPRHHLQDFLVMKHFTPSPLGIAKSQTSEALALNENMLPHRRQFLLFGSVLTLSLHRRFHIYAKWIVEIFGTATNRGPFTVQCSDLLSYLSNVKPVLRFGQTLIFSPTPRPSPTTSNLQFPSPKLPSLHRRKIPHQVKRFPRNRFEFLSYPRPVTTRRRLSFHCIIGT